MQKNTSSLTNLDTASIIKITVSGPRKMAAYKKINIAPHMGKHGRFFQATCFFDDKVQHKNLAPETLPAWLVELAPKYRQLDIKTTAHDIKVLTNRSGSIKVLQTPANRKAARPAPHNREKEYILGDGKNIAWLAELGITNKNGEVLHAGQKKFRQINRFLETVKDIADEIPSTAHIIDAGCGKSYLSFASYYYLNEVAKKQIKITGLDLKADVIQNCQALSNKLGFDGLNFACTNIADYQPAQPPHALISLHACDTATDHALYGAIKWGCKVILAAPCCQHELYSQIKNQPLNPMLKHGILKERFAALMTDTLRATLLEACGYKTTVMEFIDSAHTPKNIMLRAIKRTEINPPAMQQYHKLADEYALHPKLYQLIQNDADLRCQLIS